MQQQQQPNRLFKDTFSPCPFSSKSSRKINFYSSSFNMPIFSFFYSFPTSSVTELLRSQFKIYPNWTSRIYKHYPRFAYSLQNKLNSQVIQKLQGVKGFYLEKWYRHRFRVRKQDKCLWKILHQFSYLLIQCAAVIIKKYILLDENYIRCMFGTFSKYT